MEALPFKIATLQPHILALLFQTIAGPIPDLRRVLLKTTEKNRLNPKCTPLASGFLTDQLHHLLCADHMRMD